MSRGNDKRIKASYKEYLIQEDSEKKLQEFRFMIAEVQNLLQLAVTNVTAAHTDLKKWNSKVDTTLKQLRSTEMLYASVLMQRVLLGLVLVAAIVNLIRYISSDVTLLRSLAFSRISYLYSTSARDSKAFSQFFELMYGPEGHRRQSCRR